MVPSACPYLYPFSHSNKNLPNFAIFKSPSTKHFICDKASLKRIVRLIRCAKSNGAIHFPVSPLVPKAEAKTYPNSRFLILHLQTPLSIVKTSPKRVDTHILY